MITIFTTPKPFKGPWITIQQNALLSYVRFHPEVEVIVFDADERCDQFCARHGIRCLPAPKTNEYGTPLVGPLFAEAMKVAAHELIMYINADTILLPDFHSVLQRIGFKDFLLVGRTFGVEVDEPLDVGFPADEQRLRHLVERTGNRRSGQDYFVFTRQTWATIPDFAIGRAVWANWLLFDVFRRGIPVIDASGAAITAVHQNHDWSSHPGGWSWIWDGPEIKRNLALAPEIDDLSGYLFVTWTLGKSGRPKRVVSRRIIFWKIKLLAGDSTIVRSRPLTKILWAMLFPTKALRALQGKIR